MIAIQKTVLYEKGLDHELIDDVHDIPGGGAIKRCIQCGTCSGTCPLSWAMQDPPRKIIAMIRAGMRAEVLESETLWTCASCYSCTARCPQEIKITDIMYILKRLAIREGRVRSEKVSAFSRIFVELVNEYGRNHELALMRRFMLATRPFGAVKEGGVGWKLKVRGRLPIGGSRVKDIEGLRKIIAKAQELGGE